MDVVTREVEGNEELEQQGVAGICACKIAQETRCCAPVRHHVENSSKLGRLIQRTRSLAVDGIQKTAYSVQQGACPRVLGHVVQRYAGEDDSCVADKVGDKEENILVNAGIRSILIVTHVVVLLMYSRNRDKFQVSSGNDAASCDINSRQVNGTGCQLDPSGASKLLTTSHQIPRVSAIPCVVVGASLLAVPQPYRLMVRRVCLWNWEKGSSDWSILIARLKASMMLES